MEYALILAGGEGKRFWPLSRQDNPKQFLSLCDDKPMIELTVKRVRRLIAAKRVYIATNVLYQRKLNRCLGALKIPKENLLFEPVSRNTLAPIGVFAKKVFAQDAQGVVVVLPSDSFVKNEAAFIQALEKAVAFAKNDYIVTLGIVPQRPDTGFGYIRAGRHIESYKAKGFRVKAFIEKPSLVKAKAFMKSKQYFWNAGIFVFKAGVMLEEIKNYASSDYSVLSRIKNDSDLKRSWPRFKATSIDYAVMEKTKRCVLVPVECGWSDVGSLRALEEFAKKDKNGNVFRGTCVDRGSKNIFAVTQGRLLATLGLKDIVIVDTPDALLVCAKEKAQDVKNIVELLKERKLHRYI